jgi:NADH-quinone oxidoreductase subunit A
MRVAVAARASSVDTHSTRHIYWLLTVAWWAAGRLLGGRNREDWLPGQPRMPSYLPVLILIVVAAGFATVTLVLSHVIGRPRPTPAKLAPYECGVPAIGNARERFPIRFFLVCLLFILLDVDAAFLYPWALVVRELGLFGLIEMFVFVGILAAGFVYAWKSGALDW